VGHSEYERKLIAEKQYDNNLSAGDSVKIKVDSKPMEIGTVSKIYDDNVSGVKAIVIEEPSGNISVLFQGSKAPGEKGWELDWLGADIPMAAEILYNNMNGDTSDDLSFTPIQLDISALVLRSAMLEHPDAKVTVYGHSLGSMNAQYAMAKLNQTMLKRIDSAWLYNGPNTYSTLTAHEKSVIDSLKPKITNYIDSKDIIGLGYPKSGSDGTVGIVKRVKSKVATDKLKESVLKSKFSLNSIDHLKTVFGGVAAWFEDQHMWGGYQKDSDGNILLSDEDREVYEFEIKYYSMKSTVDSSMKKFNTLKQKWQKTGGKLSSSEELFLDAAQGQLLGNALAKVAHSGADEVSTYRQTANAKAEAIWSAIDFTSYTELPYYEVHSLFASQGITQDKFVGEFTTYTHDKATKMSDLATNFESLKSDILSMIESKLSIDKALAGEFSAWQKEL